jgi:hypothetical protein
MTQFYKGVDSGDVCWNLIQLSLDAVVPAYDLIKVPDLPLADLVALRNWILRGPPLDCFVFVSGGRDFAAYATDLERSLPPGRGAAGMSDPAAQVRRDFWPKSAAEAWLAAFDDAKSLGVLDLLNITPAKIAVLSELISNRKTQQAAAEAFTLIVKEEWDPYPLDPAQLAFNRKVKSAWDAKMYDEFCRENSASLDFAILFMVDHQEARTFVKRYAAAFDPQDHSTIRRYLPKLLEGRGPYAKDSLHMERLIPYQQNSLETLLPFA